MTQAHTHSVHNWTPYLTARFTLVVLMVALFTIAPLVSDTIQTAEASTKPAKATLKSVTSSTPGVVRAEVKSVKGATVYHFKIATDKKLTHVVKAKKVKVRTASFQGLTQGKTYWVAVRAGKKAKKVSWGAWSACKKVTCKKAPKPKEYCTISFHENGGSGTHMSDVKVLCDSNYTLPHCSYHRYLSLAFDSDGGIKQETQVLPACFVGWALSEKAEHSYTDGALLRLPAHSSHIDLYAVWSSAHAVLPSTARTGFTFKGWTRQGESTALKAQKVYEFCENTTLKALWKRNKYRLTVHSCLATGAQTSRTYLCSFDVYLDGIRVAQKARSFSRKVDYGSRWEVKNITPIDGYSFVQKKSLAQQGVVAAVDENTSTLAFKPNDYTIVFKGNGASAGTMKQLKAVYDTKVQLTKNSFVKAASKNESKYRYTFSGWAKKATARVSYKDGQDVTNLCSGGKVTLYAKWKKCKIEPGEAIAAAATALSGGHISIRTNDFTRRPASIYKNSSGSVLSDLTLFKRVHDRYGSKIFSSQRNGYWAECSSFATLAVRWSGYDQGFSAGVTGKQGLYLKNSKLWKRVGTYNAGASNMTNGKTPKPGDVLIKEKCLKGINAHICIWVGNAFGSKHPYGANNIVVAEGNQSGKTGKYPHLISAAHTVSGTYAVMRPARSMPASNVYNTNVQDRLRLQAYLQ